MGNPAFLVCDSDALIQVFLTRQRDLFVYLRDSFGVQAAIVQEIRIELSNHDKFGKQFLPPLERALASSALMLLDSTVIRRHLSTQGITGTGVDRFLEEQARRWDAYRLHVDTGEAACHATAVTFAWPALSHDISAVETLEHVGLEPAAPVLRFCDLATFAHACGRLSGEQFEASLKSLRGAREPMPYPFRDAKKPLVDLIQEFNCRLKLTEGEAPVPRGARDTLYLRRLA